MADIFRDAPLGQVIRWLTGNRYLKYPEEKPGFTLPEAWLHLLNGNDATATVTENDQVEKDGSPGSVPSAEDCNEPPPPSSSSSSPGQQHEPDAEKSMSMTASTVVIPQLTKEGIILVDWYSTDDPDNPHNWSRPKRFLVLFIMCLYTFIVYITSAIFVSSIQGVMQQFGVSEVKANLGLSIYVLGYGLGPLIFSPLSEIPSLGRSPIYAITMILFVIISIPTAFAPNFAGLIVLRFLQGFFGSPVLASGGASLGDIFSLLNLPFAIMFYVTAAGSGPALGPLLSGFAVPAKGWRWSLFESLWASGPIMVLMLVLLPETSTPNILLRRARRLRRLTGNQRLVSQGELHQRSLTPSKVVFDALIKPMEITIKDPAMLFVQVYTAIVYAIYYSFFEVFPLVFPVFYDMNLGQVGIIFLNITIANILGLVAYGSYIYYYVNPRIMRFGMPVQESTLFPALFASFGPPIGLFIFAWTARSSIHWIAPTIGITIYNWALFIIMQCIFLYVPLSYHQYAASLFAANAFFRGAMACGCVLFANPLFANLGVARGTSLLGGLSVIGIIGIFLLYTYGARLRALSKFAVSS